MISVRYGLDPWSLINIPGELFEEIVRIHELIEEERERQQRRDDLRSRLRGALGR